MELSNRSKSLGLLTTTVLVIALIGFVALSGGRVTSPSESASATGAITASTAVMTRAATGIATVPDGGTVPIGNSGAELVLTTSSACIRPAQGQGASVASDIPTACFGVNDPNLALALNRYSAASYGSGKIAVVYGIAGPEAASVKAWNGAGSAAGTIVAPAAGGWVAFYAILPFESFVADAQHAVPPRDNVEVLDSQGRVMGQS